MKGYTQLANVEEFTFNMAPIARASQKNSSTTFTTLGYIGIANNKQPTS